MVIWPQINAVDEQKFSQSRIQLFFIILRPAKGLNQYITYTDRTRLLFHFLKNAKKQRSRIVSSECFHGGRAAGESYPRHSYPM